MDCLRCSTLLLSEDEAFFYVKGEKDVSLSMKPECQAFVLEQKKINCVRETPKKVRIKCGECNSNVGSVLPFGPRGTQFYAFGVDHVKLCGRTMTKKQRWWSSYKEFQRIETRDINSFYNVLKVNINTEDMKKEEVEQLGNIVFPSVSNLTDFEWYSVSLVKKPRIYQLQAFIEVLQRNLVVVIETGMGKTLIASMLLGRMCSLNPNRLGLMIVDRIPLVFQQGNAIQQDTNLRVARICGENKTAYKMKQINNGAYDVIVVTAGAFFEMAQRKEVDVNLFCVVVFDECHHMTGNHRYVDCLKLFTKTSFLEQPRILGLSASLLNADTVIQATNRLSKFMMNFPNAKIFHPSLPKSDKVIKKKTVSLSLIQKMFITEVVSRANTIIQWICQVAGIPFSQMELKVDLLMAYRVKGDLRSLEGEYLSTENFDEQVKTCLILMEAAEICAILGVPSAWKLLEDNKLSNEIGASYKDITELSHRLEELKHLLRYAKPTSKILVFVSTRNVARDLFNCLKEFSGFNPRKVFGHGGYDGMIWEGEQECVLEEFKAGRCNLLISTSILEEGLDVSACDLVVCFSGVKSLIQFIQSRGRARKEGSQFIVLQSEEETQHNIHMEEREKMMSAVLNLNQQSYCYFSDLSKGIIRKIEQQMMINEGAMVDAPISLLDVNERSKEFTFNVYAEIIDGIDVNKMKLTLLHMLEEYQDFRVIRLEMITDDTNTYLFSPKTITNFLVGAVCSQGISADVAYINFCRSFNFLVEMDDFTSKVWIRQNTVVSNVPESPQTVTCSKYSVGFLRDRISAGVQKEFERDADVVFTPRKYIEIMYYGGDHILVVPLASFGDFALLSLHSQELILIIPLKYPPMLYKIVYTIFNEPKRVRIDVDTEKELSYFADNSVLFLTFDIHKRSEIRQIVTSRLHFPVYTFDVVVQFLTPNAHIDISTSPSLCDIMYMLKCLEDCRAQCFPTGFVQSIISYIKESKKAVNIDLVQLVVSKVYSTAVRNHYFFDLYSCFNNVYQEYSRFPIEMRDVLRLAIPQNHYIVKRVVVTPCRVVALPPVPVASNRLLRKLKSRENVVIVSFKDEDMTKLSESLLFARIRDTLIRGILIYGVNYSFLLCSGSQLRSHQAYFISDDSNEDVMSIRNSIIPNPNSFNVCAKYLSRLGQYGTADNHVATIPQHRISWINDIKADNGDLTTDGSGKISLALASTISKINTPVGIPPSAFQIRYSGVKGVVVVCPDSDPDFQGTEICLRQSMKKFSNDDKELCVVGYSKIFDLCLNREVITLLSAIKADWFLGNILMRYQEDALAEFANIFMDRASAQKALKTYLPGFLVETLKSTNFDIIEEKYWFKVLQGIYRMQVDLLKRKSWIPIKKACTLIGVPDPVGVLEEDEVFIQLNRGGGDTEVLRDPALIYRNPCLHPGDHRRVNCVYKEELMFLSNVIVMPIKGTYSLASACSGGDLDGDKFGIIWDSNLVPDEEFIFPPCQYSSLVEEESPSFDCSGDLEDAMSVEEYECNDDGDDSDDAGEDVTSNHNLAKFYITFMENDCLGKVAHKHLALCDILHDGARDPLAIKLAKSQAMAVDYPKTGILPKVPKQALKHVKEEGFPDFMEKATSVTYISKKILGYLYRRCVSVAYNFELSSKRDTNMIMNTHLLVEGNEEYLEEAVSVYRHYAHNMEMVMVKFDLKVEADVVLGYATFGWGVHYTSDKGTANDAIVRSYEAIVSRYREIFFSNAQDTQSQKQKASAWYRIVNDPSIKIRYNHMQKEEFLSFPWMVYDILCDILATQNRKHPSRVNFCIGESTIQLFKKNSAILNKKISEKMKVLKDIENSIDQLANTKHSFVINLYGSTSIYVCEPESDVDIFVYPKPTAYKSFIPISQRSAFEALPGVEIEKHFLRTAVSPAVDRIASSKKELLDRKHPIVKCSLGDADNPISCDISMNEVGMRKTMYIHYLYITDVCYFPVFWLLVRWARVAGLVKSLDESKRVMDTADFYALIIKLLECPAQPECKIEKPKRNAGLTYLFQCLDKMRFTDVFRIGTMIVTFFRKASHLKGNLKINWPASQIPMTSLDETVLDQVALAANNSYHILATCRDVANLHCHRISNEVKHFQKVLPLAISYAIGKAHNFHAARLTHITGAIVTIEMPEGKENLVLKAEGTQTSLDNLRSEIRTLLTTNKALVLGRLPTDTSRYFMQGSSIVMACGNSHVESRCTFSDSFGAYELLHHAHTRESLILNKEVCDDSWEETEYNRLVKHIYMQMEAFPKANEELKKSIEVTARFGCFYVINRAAHMPVAQGSISIQDFQCSLEKGRRSRKAWKRAEFNKPKERLSEEKNFAMVNLPPSSTPRFAEEIRGRVKRQSRCKKGIAAAFTPGFLKLNTRNNKPRERLLQIYHNVLTELGYSVGATHARRPWTWKVSCEPSTSYEVSLVLDVDFTVIKATERPLNWVHATIISGGSQTFNDELQSTCDVRMQISSTDGLKEGSSLYNEVLPEVNSKKVLPISIKDGKPVISPLFAKKSKQIVSSVRHVQTMEMYTNGSIDASVVYGDNYFGHNLVLNRPFCELSLYFNSEKLSDCVNEYLDEELLRELVYEYFNTCLIFKKTIEKALKITQV